jgi:hypothetical protein
MLCLIAEHQQIFEDSGICLCVIPVLMIARHSEGALNQKTYIDSRSFGLLHSRHARTVSLCMSRREALNLSAIRRCLQGILHRY